MKYHMRGPNGFKSLAMLFGDFFGVFGILRSERVTTNGGKHVDSWWF